MTEGTTPQKYLVICEIGPIYDFVRHSRKTTDYWGSSFLFSYLMARISKAIEGDGGTLFLPYLKDSPLYEAVKGGKSELPCGSVPDQIYAIIDDQNREQVLSMLRGSVLDEIVREIVSKVKEIKNVELVSEEIKSFFNLFFIIHPISGSSPKYDEFIEAERKIKMRSLFVPFNQNGNYHPIKKWEKCSLCGDRKKVHDSYMDSNGVAEYYREEHICSVCCLKRFFHEYGAQLTNKSIAKPDYDSTSDIAAIPLRERYKELAKYYTTLLEQYESLLTDADSTYKEDKKSGRRFFDTSLPSLKGFRDAFRGAEKAEKNASKDTSPPFPWLDRAFYSVVYMDGDNMGTILKQNNDNFQDNICKISQKISEFSKSVNGVVKEYKGQLIFAGGEDVNFMIHPEYMLDCIKDLSNLYNELFKGFPDEKMFTLSTGAVVCSHKYPLSLAIAKASAMLKCAKKTKDKNASAFLLVKGHTETLKLTISNTLIDKLKELKECLVVSDISRTTPDRIREAREIFDALPPEGKIPYLEKIITSTREESGGKADADSIVKLLSQFSAIETMTSALLFARFLAGDK